MYLNYKKKLQQDHQKHFTQTNLLRWPLIFYKNNRGGCIQDPLPRKKETDNPFIFCFHYAIEWTIQLIKRSRVSWPFLDYVDYLCIAI